jgi:two-component system response regulator FlrC
LDEIGEMRADLQAKLLRVLQEKEVERLGSTKTQKLDVRVLSASNIDMKKAIENGDFREDLFYRLNVFPMRLPPLRERPRDIAAITDRLLQRHCGRQRVEPMIAAPAMKALIECPWPGNIRELDNVIQRALVMMSGDTIHSEDLMFDTSVSAEEEKRAPHAAETDHDPIASTTATRDNEPDREITDLKEREAHIILKTLKANDGHRQKTAEALNISPRTLRYKLAKFKEQGLDVV